jgi:hypothetical protein
MNMKPNKVCSPHRTNLKITFARYMRILRNAHNTSQDIRTTDYVNLSRNLQEL